MQDRFKFIKDFEKYSACSNGHIYSNDYNHTGQRKMLKETLDKDGYPYVRFVLNKKPTEKMVEDFTKRVRGENNPKSKIDYRTACIIRKARENGIMLKYIARKFNISISQVSAICRNKFWKGNIYENPELLESN